MIQIALTENLLLFFQVSCNIGLTSKLSFSKFLNKGVCMYGIQMGFEPLMTLHALTTEIQKTFC